MLRTILTLVQVISAFAIIGLVLLQRGKGAEAGAGFGAGASGTVFGARGATTALSRATAVFAAVFMINSLALAYMGTRTTEAAAQKTILDEAAPVKPGGGAPLGGDGVPPRPGPAAAPPAAAPGGRPARRHRRAPAPGAGRSAARGGTGERPDSGQRTDTGAEVTARCAAGLLVCAGGAGCSGSLMNVADGVELEDTLAWGASAARRVGSNPTVGTKTTQCAATMPPSRSAGRACCRTICRSSSFWW